MRTAVRICLAVALVLLFGLGLLVRHLLDLGDQYHAGSYILDLIRAPESASGLLQSVPVEQGDKVIVMGRLEEEDVSWVEEELPELVYTTYPYISHDQTNTCTSSSWQRALYTVNPSLSSLSDAAVLKTPMNKGNEAMAYLTYIIDHYTTLPSTMAFLHSHRAGFLRAWHVDAPLHDNAVAMRALQLDFVQQNGYVNLRCNPNPGCLSPETDRVSWVTDEVWREIFAGTSTGGTSNTSSNSTGDAATSYSTIPVSGRSAVTQQQVLKAPERVSAACCAQFAVSREQVFKRPLEDYIQFRDWVIKTERDNRSSGRVMEYLWHIIFSMDPV